MLFHFIGFKLVTLCRVILRKGNIGDIASLVPPAHISSKWWFIYVIGAMFFSVVVWKVLMRFSLIRILSGQDKKFVSDIYNKYSKAVR